MRTALLVLLFMVAAFQVAPAAESTTSFGDLTHLEFTATENLQASFVSPQTGEASSISATQVVVSTVKGAGIELSANGTPVAYKQLGKRTVNVKTGETQYFFYGVPLAPGPNTLTAVALGAHGLRGTPISETVFGPGDPASIQADFAQHVIADGKTLVPMRVWVRDRYGHAAQPGVRLQITIVRGDARVADPVAAAPQPAHEAGLQPESVASPAAQQTVEETLQPGAYAQIGILPGTRSGSLEVEITCGDAHVRQTFYVAPFLRKPLVDGVISFGTGAVSGDVDGDGIADGGGARRTRAALYASGKAGKNSLVTLAYESQNRLSPVSSYGPFVQNPSERPYQTYGDASEVSDTLHSEDHLYARIENGRDSATWGQFNAQLGSDGAGAYHQLLSGAHVQLGDRNDRYTVDAFTARNDMAFISQTLPVLGLASLLSQLRPNIVVGSDYLQLVALDRRTGLQVSQTPLTRNVDYTIDYATGTLRFINVPLPYDANFNPQAVQLQYQYEGPGVLSRTTGASVSVHAGADRGTILQAGYVNDATGTQNFALLSQSITRQWQSGTVSLSHAASYGALPNPGDPFPALRGGGALTFQLNQQTLRDGLAVSFQNTSAGFSDPFGGVSMPGLLAYRASYTRGSPRHVAVTFSADGQSNRGTGMASSESNLTTVAHWFLTPKLTVLGGFLRHVQHAGDLQAPAPSATALPYVGNQWQTQAQLGMEYKPAKRIGVTLQQYRTLSGNDAGSTQPSQTLAQFSYDLPGRGRVYMRQLWTDVATTTFANASSGITFGSGATHSLQMGIEQALSAATSVTSDYVVNGTGSSKNIYSALGVQEKLKFSKFFSGNVLAQSAAAFGAGAQGFTLFGGTLSYANGSTLRGSLAYQARSGIAGGSTLASGIAGHLTPALAIVAAIQRANSQNAASIDDKVSLAYRPQEDDRFISIFSYQRSNGGFSNGGAANVVSFEELYRPAAGWEVAGHAAYKIDGDSYYRAHTAVWSMRARRNISRNFDFGAETQIVAIPGISRAGSMAFASETGYSVQQTRFALGYNFSASADPSLTGHAQHRGMYFTVTTLLDRFFGWGKDKQ